MICNVSDTGETLHMRRREGLLMSVRSSGIQGKPQWNEAEDTKEQTVNLLQAIVTYTGFYPKNNKKQQMNFLKWNIFYFLIFIFTLFYFTILYWFCHILTWIHHGCTCDPMIAPAVSWAEVEKSRNRSLLVSQGSGPCERGGGGTSQKQEKQMDLRHFSELW